MINSKHLEIGAFMIVINIGEHMKNSLNMQSKAYTGNTVIPANTNRRYIFIIFTSDSGTVEVGGGGGLIPFPVNGFFEPYICPSSEISIVTVGDFTVLSND